MIDLFTFEADTSYICNVVCSAPEGKQQSQLKKKAFSRNQDSDEEKWEAEMPQLIEVDLSELDQPIILPKIRSVNIIYAHVFKRNTILVPN